jgi:hypothetical protein
MDKHIVISASRRTDIPAFYMPWFMAGVRAGHFEVVNPFSRKKTRVPAASPPVHTIVFWSKDFGAFLAQGYGTRLRQLGYQLFFQFTINSESPLLEPRVPPLPLRLRQLEALCRLFGPRAVNWRFDPICFYRQHGGALGDNLRDFGRIAAAAAAAGIRRCTVSFMDHYAKILKRTASMPGFSFVDPPPAAKLEVLLRLEREAERRGMQLYTCCESELLAGLPAGASVQAGACIPSDLLMELGGGRLSVARDRGQRLKAGCQCRVSLDIGSYGLHPCCHACLFCYANPGRLPSPAPGERPATAAAATR